MFLSVLQRKLSNGYKSKGLITQTGDYQLIMPIRLMAALEDDPILCSRLDLLMEHREERQKEAENWSKTTLQVVQPIRTRLKKCNWSEDSIQRCVGLVRTNATQTIASSITLDGTNSEDKDLATIRVLYPSMSIMSHSCIPNTRTIHQSNYTLEVRAMRKVKLGEELTISYTGKETYLYILKSEN